MRRNTLKKQISSALLVAAILMIITGIGIAEPGLITPLTFGILDKLTSYRIHMIVWGPFTVLFILHIVMHVIPRNWLE